MCRHSVAIGILIVLLLARQVSASQSANGGNAPPHATSTLRIGVDSTYPPFTFQDDCGQAVGFNVELAKAIAQVMEMPVQIKAAPWNEVLHGLMEDRIDVIAGMCYSPERSQTVLFSSPISVVHHTAFARTDAPLVRSEADLRGKRLVVQRGDIMHDYVVKNHLTEHLSLVDTMPDALREIASGQHDYALLGKLPGLYWIEHLGLTNVTSTGPLLCPSEFCFAVPRGQDRLAAAFGEGLAILKKTGKYREIYDHWLGVYERDSSRAQEAIKYICAASLAIFILLALVAILLTRTRQKLERWLRERTIALASANVELRHEIEERRRAEESLQQTSEQLQAIHDGIIEGLLITNIATKRFVRVNESMCRMVGYSREELLNLSVKDLHPPENVADNEQRFQALVDGTITLNENRPTLRKDGSVFFADITGHSILYEGQPCVLALYRDITDRLREQQELRDAKQIADAANLAKSEFLANMSHEIRTPMTAILGFADILSATPSSQETAECADIIKRNGEHLIEIINDILDLSKIEAGNQQVEGIACSPAQVINDVVATMRVRADAKGLTLSCKTNGVVPDQIRTDPIRLRQILVNLIGNAVKFTEVGWVQIVMKHVANAGATPILRFDVIDTGIGMSEDQLALLFKPFSQADGSTHRRFGGTGLGLAISKRLATMLGGNIEVSSVLGKGSVFSLTIAADPMDATTQAEPSPQAKPRSTNAVTLNGRILLVEDGPDNRRLISHVLKKAGAEVTLAENGQIGVELSLAALRSGLAFDAILMDMQMPVMDGYESTRLLRNAGYRGPIIALTAHAMTEDRARCIEAGCDDYISKPLEARHLRETVAKHIRKPPTGRESSLRPVVDD